MLNQQAILNRFLNKRGIEQFFESCFWILICASAAWLSWVGFQSFSLYVKTQADISLSDQSIQSALTNINTGGGATKDEKTDFRALANKNLFGELTTVAQPEPEVVVDKNQLKLALIGTFITDGENPFAIIESKKNNEQDVFEKDELVFESAKLIEIATDYVKIDRNGQIETLRIEDEDTGGGEESGGGTSDGETIQVDATELDSALSNLPVLLTQARAVPYFKDGASVGLRLFAIRPGSLFEKIGLKNGDILKSINGSSLADITQAIKLFEKLKEEKKIGLVLERNRQDQSVNYVIN